MDRLAHSIFRRFKAESETEPEPEDNYSAGHLYVCPDDETVFLTKRSGIMHHPYKWDIVGGRSDDGEDDPTKTAIREAEEELHVLPKIAKPIGMHVQTWKKDGKDYSYYIYVYAISEDEKVRWTPKIELSDETAGFKWFKIDELPSKKELHFDLSWLAADLKKAGKKTASTNRMKFALESIKPRYEHKYWISLDKAAAIREFLAPHVAADEHGKNYTIQNIYLDNPDLEFFRDHAVRGKEAHLKLRVRTYKAGSEVFLEVKEKTRGVCSKTRSIVPIDMYATTLKTASAHADRIPFVRLAIEHGSGPIVRLDYDREAYNAFEAEGRVTIDTNIRYAKHTDFGFLTGPKRTLLPPEFGILELKFSGEAPDFMRKLVANFKLKRQSISKYCMSVAELLRAQELREPPGLFG